MEKQFGLIGGGQLGFLLCRENNEKRKFPFASIYSPTRPLSAGMWTQADLNDTQSLLEWGKYMDVITIEIEDVSVEALSELKKLGKTIIPNPDHLAMIKNKLSQKKWLISNNFPTSSLLAEYNSKSDYRKQENWYKVPQVHKLQVGGYDGRGVDILTSPDPKSDVGFDKPSIVEEYIEIKHEVSVIVARDLNGEIINFQPSLLLPDPDTKMLDILVSPLPKQLVSKEQSQQICEIARSIAKTMNCVGLLAIEFFITNDDKILVNEMSPRPHNSGHHTIEQYDLSQNEILRRILLGKEITQPEFKIPDTTAITCNIIGTKFSESSHAYSTLFKNENTHIHYYFKEPCKLGRKMGHVTCYPIRDFKWELLSDLTLRIKHSYKIKHDKPEDIGEPLSVAVIMGSSSDLSIVQPALQILDDFNVPYLVKVVSAHRTPEDMIVFAKKARQANHKVIIAAAGGAAHLPGMVASATTLPVIGIPVKSHNSMIGLDSLLSIGQMPQGIPVATMSIDGSINAALYAVRILSLSDTRLSRLLDIYELTLKEKVERQNKELRI